MTERTYIAESDAEMKRLVRAAFLQKEREPTDENILHYEKVMESWERRDWAIDQVLSYLRFGPGAYDVHNARWDITNSNIAVGTNSIDYWTAPEWDTKNEGDLYLSSIRYLIRETDEFLLTYKHAVGIELYRIVGGQFDNYFHQYFKEYSGYYDSKYVIEGTAYFPRIHRIDTASTLCLVVRNWGADIIDAYIWVRGIVINNVRPPTPHHQT